MVRSEFVSYVHRKQPFFFAETTVRLRMSYIGLLALALWSPAPARGQARSNGSECVVQRVVDGDTFVCAGGPRVRLLLIDAPELAQRPYGDSARAVARALLPAGARVRLETDVQTHDEYGRLLAYVYADSVFVNREMVRRGMALVLVYPPNVREVETIRSAADSARAERRGLWSGSAFDCRPRDYRARRCR
jgi:micrococcal nuclease